MTYMYHDDKFIYIKATAREAHRVGGVYLPVRRLYKLPKNIHTMEVVISYDNNERLLKAYEEEKETYDSMKDLKSSKVAPEGSDERLRPYQAIDVEIIKRNPILAIFNEQRTGKTPTILSALKNENRGLIVCPSSLKLNWLKEFDTWHNGKAVVISGTKAKRLKLYESIQDETIIIGYETLRVDLADFVKYFKTFEFMVVDEAHRLRNYETKQSKALYTIRKIAKRVYPMTGTPAVSRPADVLGVLRFMYPAKYRSYWQFVERYVETKVDFFGKTIVLGLKPKNQKEFYDLLNKHSIQRKRKDVMNWIPKVTFTDIVLEPTPKQVSLFKEIKKLNKLKDEELTNPLTKLLRLRQIAVDPFYVGEDEVGPKFKFILDYLEDNPEDRVVIFSTMTGALKRLNEKVNGVLLTGEQTTEKKQQAVNDFQSGKTNVLLANIKAGGVGFTLDQADTIIFLDKSYTPDENQQAADRLVPTNPDAEYGAKQVLTLLVNGSVEPKIEKLLRDKINITTYVNDYGLTGIVD